MNTRPPTITPSDEVGVSLSSERMDLHNEPEVAMHVQDARCTLRNDLVFFLGGGGVHRALPIAPHIAAVQTSALIQRDHRRFSAPSPAEILVHGASSGFDLQKENKPRFHDAQLPH
ncbi:unnamed protein product [Arctogadus glacialis]